VGNRDQRVTILSNWIAWRECLVCCLTAVAAATEAVLVYADIIAMCELTVHVPDAVYALFSQAKTAHLTPARHYQNVLLTMSHVTLKRCTVRNQATLLQTKNRRNPRLHSAGGACI
jgi:hypothetical protein